MNTQIGTIDVGLLKQKLLQRKNMKNRFRLPLSFENAKVALKVAVEVEVMSRFGTFDFSKDVDSQLSKMAKWLTADKQKFGMMFCGGVGNGKTSLMKAFQSLLNALNIRNENDTMACRPYSIRIVDAKTIVEQYQANRQEFIGMKRCEMLGIDDMGIETLEIMEYGNVHTPIVDLLSARYESQLFTIVSTNLTPSQIRERYGERIADRFNEMMERIVFKNPTYRH